MEKEDADQIERNEEVEISAIARRLKKNEEPLWRSAFSALDGNQT